jgi:hypothetical protein
MSTINIDDYRKKAKGTYTVLNINTDDPIRPELTSETLGSYDNVEDLVNTIVFQYNLNPKDKIESYRMERTGPNNNIIKLQIYERRSATYDVSNVRIYRIYTRDQDELYKIRDLLNSKLFRRTDGEIPYLATF